MTPNELTVQFTFWNEAEKDDARFVTKGMFASMNFKEPDVRIRQRKHPVPPEKRDKINELFEEVNELIEKRLAE